jgi:hypothetical protein
MKSVEHHKNLESNYNYNTIEPMTNNISWQQFTYPYSPTNIFPVCSLIQANWSDPISKLSTNVDCICPVGNKASNTINGIKTYKCQIPYPNPQ